MQSDEGEQLVEDDKVLPISTPKQEVASTTSVATRRKSVADKSTTNESSDSPERRRSVIAKPSLKQSAERRKSVSINGEAGSVASAEAIPIPVDQPSSVGVANSPTKPTLPATLAKSASFKDGTLPAVNDRRKSVSINASAKVPPERRKSSVVNPSTNSRKNSSFHNFYKNVFVPDAILTQSTIQEDHSVDDSTHHTFTEQDFKLPDLEVQIGMDLNDVLLHQRHKKELRKIKHEIVRERVYLSRLDDLAHTSDDKLASQLRKGYKLSASATRKLRVKLECEAELATIRQIAMRKPGELTDKLKAMKEQIESESVNGIDDHQRESSIDHPALDSVHEKMEDLRQEECEKWCRSRGKDINEKYTNLEKRMLRKWFKELDYDGSGEVNVEELQDPMLSSGILKTREQVVRVLANVDKNNTMGIDFEEFLVAISANKLADTNKLKRLQEMSANPFFDVDTLITAERRKKLFKSIIKQCQMRQADIDKLYKKYDKPKLSRKEREMWARELDELEEQQSRSIFLHSKYLHALDGVLEDKKEFYAMQRADREKMLEETRPRDVMEALMARPGFHLSQDAHAATHTSTEGSLSGVGIAGASHGHAGSHHNRHLAHLHAAHHSHASSHASLLDSSAHDHTYGKHGEEVEVLRNPYSIYAPPTPKYNKKKVDFLNWGK